MRGIGKRGLLLLLLLLLRSSFLSFLLHGIPACSASIWFERECDGNSKAKRSQSSSRREKQQEISLTQPEVILQSVKLTSGLTDSQTAQKRKGIKGGEREAGIEAETQGGRNTGIGYDGKKALGAGYTGSPNRFL